MKVFAFFFFVASVTLIGCSQDTVETSTVRVLLTDIPSTRYDSVIIYIHQVNLWCGCTTTPEVILSQASRAIDVLTLRNGGTAEIGAGKPEQRAYKHIKLYIDSGAVVKNGTKTTVLIPGGPQIKDLEFLEVFETGKSYDMIIDFDAARSILDSAGKQYLKPRARAVLGAKCGSIKGTLNKWATVWATIPPSPADSSYDTLTTYTLFSSSPPDSFTFAFLKPGTYTIGARDSGGNVSATQTQTVSTGITNANVTITIP